MFVIVELNGVFVVENRLRLFECDPMFSLVGARFPWIPCEAESAHTYIVVTRQTRIQEQVLAWFRSAFSCADYRIFCVRPVSRGCDVKIKAELFKSAFQSGSFGTRRRRHRPSTWRGSLRMAWTVFGDEQPKRRLPAAALHRTGMAFGGLG